MVQARRRLLTLGSIASLGAVAASLAACFSSSSGGATPDAGPDVLFEIDAAADGEVDATADTTTDAAVESAADVTLDTISPVEAAQDSAGETSFDSPAEATIEAGPTGPTLYVDPVNGLDTNPGTQTAPFKSIYQATLVTVADAGTGLNVYLADGTYDASNQAGFWGAFRVPTFLRGSAPGKALLVGTYANEVMYFAAGGGIENVTFQHTTYGFQSQHGTFTASGVTLDGLPGFNGWSMSFINDAVATLDSVTEINTMATGGQDIGACIYVDQTANVVWHATGNNITASASPGFCIFERAQAQLAIDGLTVTNLPSAAAVLYDQAQLTLTNSTITGTGGKYPCSGPTCFAAVWLGGSQTGVPAGTLTLNNTSITGGPGSAVAYSTTTNTGVVNLTMTGSHLDNNNAYAGVWLNGSTNAALDLHLTATGTTFDGNAMSGITAAPKATISVTGGSISNNGAGAGALGQTPGAIVMLDAASANALTMRNVTMATNAGNFVSVPGTAASTLDLGTTASVGGNTFSGVTVGAGKSALNLTALINASAVGNTWMPSVQGSDSTGPYTTAMTITGPAAGLNVTVPMGASVVVE